MKNKPLPQLCIIIIRYLLGLAFVFSSIIKIKGLRFTGTDGIDAPINSAWHFFETMYQSRLYWKFLGLGQLIAGGLLMTQRYARLGIILFLPIITNIFIITLSYNFNGTPIITGMMFFATLLLVVWDWDTLKVLANQQPKFPLKHRLENDKIWEIIGVSLFSFTVVYRIFINEYNLFLWVGICSAIGIIGILMGWKRINSYYK